MNNNIKKFLFICSFILSLFSFSFALANPVVPGARLPSPDLWHRAYDSLPAFFLALVFTLLIEILFGYLLFFRKNKKGLLAILVGNLISFPIFCLYVLYVFNVNVLFFIALGELGVIFFEMFMMQLFLRNEISLKKAFLVSLVLNILSLILYGLLNYFQFSMMVYG